jgi:hypothetical protein
MIGNDDQVDLSPHGGAQCPGQAALWKLGAVSGTKRNADHRVTGPSITICYCLDLRQTSSINPHAHRGFLPVKHSGTKIDMTKVCQICLRHIYFGAFFKFDTRLCCVAVLRSLDVFSFGASVSKNILDKVQ